MFTVDVRCCAVKSGPLPGGRVLVVVLSVLLLIDVVSYFGCSSCLVWCRCLDLLFGLVVPLRNHLVLLTLVLELMFDVSASFDFPGSCGTLVV